jgi:mevalonate kinase
MIQASAPAKIILFGEHAVVYGHPAIAAPVSSLRAFAEAVPNSAGFRIIAEDFGQVLPLTDLSAMVDNALLLTARLVLEHLRLEPPLCDFHVRSQIPPASGMGSGAAVSTALARAIAMAAGAELSSDVLNAIVFEIEKLYHGRPSGIDNTTIVYERLIYFVRGAPIEPLTAARPLPLLIADTGIAAPTKLSVSDVARLVEESPQTAKPALQAIGTLVREAKKAAQSGDLTNIGRLMNENQTHLRTLTVSSPELDNLVSAALDAGALGAKLSGGGRGGNMIALVTQDVEASVADALRQAGAVRVFATLVQSLPEA